MWDLELNDRELSILAEAQASLKFQVEVEEEKPVTEPSLEEQYVLVPSGPDVSELRVHVERAGHLLEGIRRLMSILDDLRMAHQRVSTKSVVLQSTWEGALSAPSQIGAKRKEIVRRLTSYSLLNEAIGVMGKTAKQPVDGALQAGLVPAVAVAREHLSVLQNDYFESAQYMVRLKQVLGYTITHLKDTMVHRLSSLELQKAMHPFETVWKDLGFLSQSLTELEKPFAEAVEAFSSLRFTQFNAQIKKHAMETAQQPNHLDLLLYEYANKLQDELIMIEKWFGCPLPNLESFAVPLLRYMRSAIDNLGIKQISFDPAGFNPLVVEHMARIIAVLEDYQRPK